MAKDPWDDISATRKRAVRSEMANRLKARGRVRGAVKGATGQKVGKQSKAIGKPSSLKGAGFSKRELDYGKAVRGVQKRSGQQGKDYAKAVAQGRKSVGPADIKKQTLKTYTKKAKAQDYAYNVAQREKTKARLGTARAKTKTHLANLRKKGASAATMQKAKDKAQKRYGTIKGKSKRRRTIIN